MALGSRFQRECFYYKQVLYTISPCPITALSLARGWIRGSTGPQIPSYRTFCLASVFLAFLLARSNKISKAVVLPFWTHKILLLSEITLNIFLIPLRKLHTTYWIKSKVWFRISHHNLSKQTWIWFQNGSDCGKPWVLTPTETSQKLY